MRADIDINSHRNHQNGRAKHLDGHNFRFYMGYKLNKELTAKENRPVHDDVEMIELINFAGERTVRTVEERDRRGYPEHYAEFQEAQVPAKTGTNLEEWCLLSRAKLMDLQFFKIRTVEELANLPKEALDRFPGIRDIHRLANSWLESAKSKQAEVTNLKEQLNSLNVRFKKLEEQHMAALRRIEANEGNRMDGVSY